MVNRIRAFSKIYENSNDTALFIQKSVDSIGKFNYFQCCGIKLSETKLITVQYSETFYEW